MFFVKVSHMKGLDLYMLAIESYYIVMHEVQIAIALRGDKEAVECGALIIGGGKIKIINKKINILRLVIICSLITVHRLFKTVLRDYLRCSGCRHHGQ